MRVYTRRGKDINCPSCGKTFYQRPTSPSVPKLQQTCSLKCDWERKASTGAQIKRLLPKIEKTDSCWIWKPYKNKLGYGMVFAGRKLQYAHRVIYELLVKKVPTGLVLDHLCRNASCVNPKHLEVVTQKENILRGVGPIAGHARQTHCKYGHPLSGKNLRLSYRKRGVERVCQECCDYRNSYNHPRKTQ